MSENGHYFTQFRPHLPLRSFCPLCFPYINPLPLPCCFSRKLSGRVSRFINSIYIYIFFFFTFLSFQWFLIYFLFFIIFFLFFFLHFLFYLIFFLISSILILFLFFLRREITIIFVRSLQSIDHVYKIGKPPFLLETVILLPKSRFFVFIARDGTRPLPSRDHSSWWIFPRHLHCSLYRQSTVLRSALSSILLLGLNKAQW